MFTLFSSSSPLADRFIQAASDFKDRPWGNIIFRLNETFDAVGSVPLLVVLLAKQLRSVQDIRWIIIRTSTP